MSSRKYLLFLPCVLMLKSCSLFYVVKQGVYQVELLAGAEPIVTALRSKDLDRNSRQKLELIENVRQFAKNSLKLKADRNYQEVNLSWHHIIHNVSASEPLKFKPYLWWFPIIGSVPYKGFFDQKDALLEQERLKSLGLETLMRPIQGYSTLGFFSDPIWPSMLRLSDDALIELIIHELAHATIYFANQTTFDETLANFIGKAGTVAYVKKCFGADSPELKRLNDYHRHLALYGEFFHQLCTKLDKIYSSNFSDDEKKIQKIKILSEAQINYLNLPIGLAFKTINWSEINNAYLLSFKRYNQDDVIFKQLLAAVDGDFGRFLDEVRYYARGLDPFTSLRVRVDALTKKL